MGGPKKPMSERNAPDTPTSVWSEMVRKQMEPQETRKANDGQRPLADASERYCPKEQSALWLLASIAKPSGVSVRRVGPTGSGLMKA